MSKYDVKNEFDVESQREVRLTSFHSSKEEIPRAPKYIKDPNELDGKLTSQDIGIIKNDVDALTNGNRKSSKI